MRMCILPDSRDTAMRSGELVLRYSSPSVSRVNVMRYTIPAAFTEIARGAEQFAALEEALVAEGTKPIVNWQPAR
jgi:hypothetical protein